MEPTDAREKNERFFFSSMAESEGLFATIFSQLPFRPSPLFFPLALSLSRSLALSLSRSLALSLSRSLALSLSRSLALSLSRSLALSLSRSLALSLSRSLALSLSRSLALSLSRSLALSLSRSLALSLSLLAIIFQRYIKKTTDFFSLHTGGGQRTKTGNTRGLR